MSSAPAAVESLFLGQKLQRSGRAHDSQSWDHGFESCCLFFVLLLSWLLLLLLSLLLVALHELVALLAGRGLGVPARKVSDLQWVRSARANGTYGWIIWNRLLAVELVIWSRAKKFSILRTTYSSLDKLSPDDATLPPVSWCTPQMGLMVGFEPLVQKVTALPSAPQQLRWGLNSSSYDTWCSKRLLALHE